MGKIAKAFKKMVRNVRRDEQEGIVMPVAYDEETNQPLYTFELLSGWWSCSSTPTRSSSGTSSAS
jgi:hypothetical protein